MKRILLLAGGAVMAALISVVAQPAMPAFPSAYSADITIKSKEFPTPIKSHYVVDGDSMRLEMNEGAPQATIMITNGAKHVSYMVMVAQRMYMQMPLNQNPMPEMARDLSDEQAMAKYKPQYIGTETVNGTDCNKYSVTSKDGTAFIWLAKSDNHPVRIAAQDGQYQVDWTNFKAGPQPASAFEPPAGFQAMKLPSMPGGMTIPGGM